MYTKSIYPISIVLRWTRRYIYFFVLLSVIPVVLYDLLGWKWLHLPWLPIGLVGTALAFINGFKNNASYGRLWEARKIYGGIVNASRLLATMVNDFISNQFTDQKKSESELFSLRKEIIMRHVAWMTSLRHALRQKKSWETTASNTSDKEHMQTIKVYEYAHTLKEELQGYLTDQEIDHVLSMKNKQAACLSLQSKQFQQLRSTGLIDDFRHMEFKHMIGELFTLQGKAERIKNFPYPRQFATLNLFFVWIFVILLPFGLMHEFDKIGQSLTVNASDHFLYALIVDNFVWLTIPFSIAISWIFMLMERVGDVSENPFEGMSNDVPITTMSRGIEIDIRELIGDDKKLIPAGIPQINDTQM